MEVMAAVVLEEEATAVEGSEMAAVEDWTEATVKAAVHRPAHEGEKLVQVQLAVEERGKVPAVAAETVVAGEEEEETEEAEMAGVA